MEQYTSAVCLLQILYNTLNCLLVSGAIYCFYHLILYYIYIYIFYFTLLIQVNFIDKQDLIIKSNQMYQICTNQDLIAECACFNFTKTFFTFFVLFFVLLYYQELLRKTYATHLFVLILQFYFLKTVSRQKLQVRV